MNMIRTAVVGIGNIGNAHATCIANGKIDGMELSAVCDTDETRLNRFLKNHSTIEGFCDYNELLAKHNFDAVIIATPHPLHAKMAISAFQNGLNVLLEKPADIAVSRVRELNNVARASNKVFSVMFNQRANPIFIEARKIVKSGKIGELKRVVWIITNWYRTQKYYQSSNWRATWSGEGGGVLLNQAPHNLDILQWICGMPEKVLAFCDIGKYHKIEVEDDANVFFRYKNGATGVFLTSTGEYPGTNRFEISGTLGKIVMENATLKFWKLKEDETNIRFNSPQILPDIEFDYSEFKSEKEMSGHKIILQNFANAIRYGEELIAPGTDGINELMLSNAAYLSNWKGNTEVELPIDSEEFDKLLLSKFKESKIISSKTDSSLKSGYQPRWNVIW